VIQKICEVIAFLIVGALTLVCFCAVVIGTFYGVREPAIAFVIVAFLGAVLLGATSDS
jgi:hypothetical protein